MIRHIEERDEWLLEAKYDGAELFARPNIELVAVEPQTIREAESQIAGCENCQAEDAQVPFNWVLAEVLSKPAPFEFVLTETAHCPNCRGPISEQTRVEPEGGVDFELIGWKTDDFASRVIRLPDT